jgi:hypothetical protein
MPRWIALNKQRTASEDYATVDCMIQEAAFRPYHGSLTRVRCI